MANIKFLKGTLTGLSGVTIADGQILFTVDQGHIYLDHNDGTSTTRIELFKTDLDALSALRTWAGDTSTTFKAQLDAAIAALSLDTFAEAGDYIEFADAGDGSLPKIQVKLSTDAGNSLAKGTDGGLFISVPASTDYTVTVTEAAGEAADAYSKRYTIAQAGTSLSATIDIPKDMVVSSGTVETFADGDEFPAGVTEAGTYLVLTLANATSDTLYINVTGLIEYVTSGSNTGDMIVIDVSSDYKVTATITDGTITKAKLATDVQAVLDEVDTLKTAYADMNVTDTAVAGQYVSQVSQTNGKIVVVRDTLPDTSWGTF